MFCPNCGTKLPDDGKTKYCVKCGSRIRPAGQQREHDEFPKAPGAGRTVAVMLCLTLLLGGAAGGAYYFATNGIDMALPQKPSVSAPSEAEGTDTVSPDTAKTEEIQDRDSERHDINSSSPLAAPPDERLTRKFEFVTPNGKDTSVSVTVSSSAYEAYRALPRYYQPDEFVYYLNNVVNDDLLTKMTDSMIDFAERHDYTRKDLAYMAIRLVQSVKYVNDTDSIGREDYPRYPIETVCEMKGDCEDLSILLVGLLRKMGFETCFVVFTDHVGVGIRLDDAENGTYFEYGGIKYYYVETTAQGWNIGAYPDELHTDAHLYFVKG